MRLAILTPSLETLEGTDQIILQIAKHFDATIHCLAYNPEKTFSEFKNLDIKVAKPTFLRKIPFMKGLASAVEAGNYFYNLKLDDYDIINAHHSPSEWARNKNSPMIWYCCSPRGEAFDLYDWYMKRKGLLAKPFCWASIKAFKYIESRTVPNIEHVFTNSRDGKERIRECLHKNSEVLHAGIDANRFASKGYEKFFFYPSKIAPEKDFEYAIKAFNIFSKRLSDWKFVIAGSLSEHPDHKRYLKKLQSLRSGSIVIETNISEERLQDLYSRCYAVLYTPLDEDCGLVPLEAMASSKPCIAKDKGSLKEIVAGGKDGFLVPSIWKMAGTMEWLAKHPERCEEIGKFGRRKVERDFTWTHFLKRFEEKARELAKS